ncbi:hypothetical protein I552_1936 [Mycobacterium xenopi 3993]|nr:hypothetical protein I552_1936 [Mycobacterium xenopi 3993]
MTDDIAAESAPPSPVVTRPPARTNPRRYPVGRLPAVRRSRL